MTPREPLDEATYRLFVEALAVFRDNQSATDRLHHYLQRLDEPVRIAVAGPWQAGKSTLINSLVGDEVAPIDPPPAAAADRASADSSQVYTWYQDGTQPHAVVYPADRELPINRSGHGMSVEVRQWRPAPVNDVLVSWPSRTLRHATLVDTPAMPVDGDSDGTGDHHPAEKILRDTDAVLYLTRDGREADLRFPQRVQQGAAARAAAVNLLLVLSRADELGGGRIDSLIAARQLARRQQRDPQVSPLCIGVVAVSGQLALAGRTLTDPEYATLRALAAAPRDQLETHLLSTDRFLDPELPAPVAVEVRHALLDRLGIFGVRLATALIRTGSDNRAKLAAELVTRGGLTELRETLNRCFVDRQSVLKARSALVALASLLQADPRPGTEQLATRLEQLLVNAHEFRELRALAWLQCHRVRFDDEPAAEARRLIGENGTALTARLGVDDRASATELRQLGMEALARWQESAEDPLLNLEQRRVARVVARSCEEVVAQLSTPA